MDELTDPVPLGGHLAEHVRQMRRQLGTAMADVEIGDGAIESSNLQRDTEGIVAAAARAEASYMSSIARSLLIIATMAVDGLEDEAGLKHVEVLPIRDDRPPVPPRDREAE
jgi:hypothetical protein